MVIHLFIDESGTRTIRGDDTSWFGMGGILVQEKDIESIESLKKEFHQRQDLDINTPLHSSEIRKKSGVFSFLKDTERCNKFYSELEKMLVKLPVIGIACIIHRQGYLSRYRNKYKEKTWDFCKTAFPICVERACKFSEMKNEKLHISAERVGGSVDKVVREYFMASSS